jgi:hypothetical protein
MERLTYQYGFPVLDILVQLKRMVRQSGKMVIEKFTFMKRDMPARLVRASRESIVIH